MPEINPIRPTTPEAIILAKTLLRSSRYGAIAVIDATSGKPLASRVAVATDVDGTPVILVSGLAAHTPALLANPSCSLLLGEVGKGDPLAHARITLHCEAVRVDRDSEEYSRIRLRYISHNPKGSLYVDLGDFVFFRLNAETASLNGGFGKAFNLGRNDLICDTAASIAFGAAQAQMLESLNTTCAGALSTYTAKQTSSSANWKIVGIDPEGADLASGDQVIRVHFSTPCTSIEDCSDAVLETLKLKG